MNSSPEAVYALTVHICSTFNDAVRKRVPRAPETDLRYEGLPTGKRASVRLSLGELNIRLGDPFAREKSREEGSAFPCRLQREVRRR